MTRTYALLRLLELGPLTRKEIREITGWAEDKLKYVLQGAKNKKTIWSVNNRWFRRYPDGSLQKDIE